MSKVKEELIKEKIKENKKEIAIAMIKDDASSFEKIAAYVDLTIEEIKELIPKEAE